MKTRQNQSDYSPKPRGYRFWIGCFTILLGLPFLLYYGYCWGWWGRHSLLLQYLFQCNCPPASEEARYPKQVDVVVPACRNVDASARLSPSGRFLYLREEKNDPASAYLLDLQTMERIEVTAQPFSSFLTDDLWFVESGLEDVILDRATGMQYPIKTFRYWQGDAYINGNPNLELLVASLHQAKHVFFTKNNDTVIVLLSEFPTDPEQNFTFDRSDIPGWNSDRVEKFLRENKVTYQTVLENFPGETVSPDGRFIARHDGIYLVETNELIVKAYPSRVRGWTNNGRGVIYSSSGPCLIKTNFFIFDDTACFFEVPQPVIKLKVPEEYLQPSQLP